MNLKRIGIIGAGTMGSGIAQACALAGLAVTMLDVSQERVAEGMQALTSSLERLVKRGALSAEQKALALQRVKGLTDYNALNGCDMVIEAATENLELKLRILQRVGRAVSAEAIIATNTSSISITQLAAVLARPGRFIGVHFFNPVAMMQLVEVIRGLQTSEETHQAALGFARAVGKTPISVKNSPGFVVNRVLCPMINEAIFALQEGLVTAEDIDSGMKLGCNHPIGPLALADMIGLDVLLAAMHVFYDGFKDPKYRPAPLLKEMVDAERLGRKTREGFYKY